MRKVLAVLLTVSLLGIAPAEASSIKAGAKCAKHKATATVNGVKFTCIKSGNRLVWNKGVKVKKASAIKAGICPPKAATDFNPGITQVRANALLTMTEAEAEACAMSLDWLYRVGQRDEEFFALTRDYRIERVTITVMKGVVTEVFVG
jgi:hypothetical protein